MGSTQQDIEVSYDVNNEFFKLWLDKQMNYTCALYADEKNFSDELETAQLQKLKRLSEYAGINSQTERVLDIGCGWGANLQYQALVNQVPEVHGITLSSQQYEYCLQRNLPRTQVQLKNFFEYEPEVKFDAVISICMIEHIVSPEQARDGKAVEIYRNYFSRVHRWTKPGACFALQAITRAEVPRNSKDLADLRHSTYTIFPGAVTPRVEDLVTAVSPYFEILQMHSRRFHYRQTVHTWRERLRASETKIRKDFGSAVFEDYDRYLSTCVRAFENNWQSLHQFQLKRRD